MNHKKALLLVNAAALILSTNFINAGKKNKPKPEITTDEQGFTKIEPAKNSIQGLVTLVDVLDKADQSKKAQLTLEGLQICLALRQKNLRGTAERKKVAELDTIIKQKYLTALTPQEKEAISKEMLGSELYISDGGEKPNYDKQFKAKDEIRKDQTIALLEKRTKHLELLKQLQKNEDSIKAIQQLQAKLKIDSEVNEAEHLKLALAVKTNHNLLRQEKTFVTQRKELIEAEIKTINDTIESFKNVGTATQTVADKKKELVAKQTELATLTNDLEKMKKRFDAAKGQIDYMTITVLPSGDEQDKKSEATTAWGLTSYLNPLNYLPGTGKTEADKKQ